MKQSKLEEKVRELFQEQGFEVDKKQDVLVAEQSNQQLFLRPFSSEEYTLKKALGEATEGEKVFVDEALKQIEEKISNPVSVIREEQEEKDYNLPSYELIGEIAVINELTVEEKEAVEGILEHHPSVKTILLKEEPLQGEYRVGEYRKLYGNETETVHTEYGCGFKVDPTKVYYSERFSTERKRVVDKIEDGEKVLVMFAGVGPFAIMAAKLANPEKVVAVEKNPVGADYLKENIELNDVEGIVEGYEGDVSEIVPKFDERFDRIIMPLPEKAGEFLDLAFDSVVQGGIVHYYCFGDEQDSNDLLEDVDLNSTKNYSIRDTVVCGDRTPSTSRLCMDLHVE